MKFGLNIKTIEKIHSVFEKYSEIEKVIIYGSRAKGNYRNGSDIDLVLCGDNLNTSFLLKIDEAIDELNLPYTFDISIYDQIDNENLLEHINRAGMDFYTT